MDHFTKTYIILMEQLNTSLFAADYGLHGNDLKMSDFWNNSDYRLASNPVIHTRSGMKKGKKSRKSKKRK